MDQARQHFDDARQHFNDALEIFGQLAQQNQPKYEPNLADMQDNLGILDKVQNRKAEARDHFMKALKISSRTPTAGPLAKELSHLPVELSGDVEQPGGNRRGTGVAAKRRRPDERRSPMRRGSANNQQPTSTGEFGNVSARPGHDAEQPCEGGSRSRPDGESAGTLREGFGHLPRIGASEARNVSPEPGHVPAQFRDFEPHGSKPKPNRRSPSAL